MKLYLEIVVDQYTRAQHTRVSDANIWSNFSSIMTNNLNMFETKLWGTLLLATSILNTYIKFDQNWTNISKIMSKKLYDHNWAPFLIDFSPYIGQILIFLNNPKKT